MRLERGFTFFLIRTAFRLQGVLNILSISLCCCYFIVFLVSYTGISGFVNSGSAGIHTASNYSSRNFRLTDNISDLELKRDYPILWYDSVSSTMDTVRTSMENMAFTPSKAHTLLSLFIGGERIAENSTSR